MSRKLDTTLNVLFVTDEGAKHKEVFKEAIQMLGDEVITFSGPLKKEMVENLAIDFIISDRYSHIIPEDVLNYVEGRAVNTHPSILPLHRGWQPIFFSVYNKTEVGVSIHQIDKGLDTGAIVFQAEIPVSEQDTLRTLHYRCRQALMGGFMEIWPSLRGGEIAVAAQSGLGGGSYHSKADFESLFPSLLAGWNSTVREVHGVADGGLEKPLG